MPTQHKAAEFLFETVENPDGQFRLFAGLERKQHVVIDEKRQPRFPRKKKQAAQRTVSV